MRKMKDSGLDIVGQMPTEWDFIRLRYLCDITTGDSDTQDADPDGEYPFYVRSPIVERSTKFTFNGEGILMAGDGAGAGRVFHHAFGKYAVHQRVYRLYNFKVNSNFLFYYISNLFPSVMDKGSAQSTVPSVRLPMLLNFEVCFPPIDEQKKIANFLDEKCSEIDSILSDVQREIEILNDYKKSVITEAITKGLNPKAKLKDSGIEWIGKIPEEWDCRPIKYGFKLISGSTPKSDNMDFWDGDVIWITPADYKTEDKYVCQGKRNISYQGFLSCSTNIVPKGSLIFSKRAPIGTVAINSVPLCTNQGCLSCVPKACSSSLYFYFVFIVYEEVFNLLGSGTTFKEISATTFSNVKLPYPSINEQKKIAAYLDEKCSEIDATIADKQKQLETLDEYKKSLIFEYVTGKKEIS